MVSRSSGLRYRVDTLIGVTGYKLAKYRATWWQVSKACWEVVWRPQFIFVIVFEVSRIGYGSVFPVLTY